MQIGGEHEDFYDSDFCIYNDVFVHGSDRAIRILGYPIAAFPPTDFHTATLLGPSIYVIGGLGYAGTRRYGETQVFRLDTATFRFEAVATSGDGPGWIFGHRATRRSEHEIRVGGGQVVTKPEAAEVHSANERTFVLDLRSMAWRVERP